MKTYHEGKLQSFDVRIEMAYLLIKSQHSKETQRLQYTPGYGSQAKSGPLSVFINKLLWKNQVHLFTYYLGQLIAKLSCEKHMALSVNLILLQFLCFIDKATKPQRG